MALITYITEHAAWADSFSHHDFRYVWGATFFQALSWGMELVALGWLVLDRTDSPFMVGVAFGVGMAPFFFLGVLSGAIADRVDRCVFLRFVALGGSFVSGLMALLLLTDVAQVWHIITLAGAGGCIRAFLATMNQAYIYDIVGPKQALNGLALAALGHRMGVLVGSLMAGWIIAGIGVGGQYLIISTSYLAALTTLVATHRVGQVAIAQRDPVIQSLLGYLKLIRQNRTLFTLMFLVASTEVFGFTHSSVLPVFARDVLGVDEVGLGFMISASQAGGIIGILTLANLREFRRKGLLMLISAAGFGLGLMSCSLTTNIFLFLAILAVVRAFASSADILYKTLLQASVSDEQRGRAMGSWVLSVGFAPAGHLGVGGMASALGAQGALLINGSILTLMTIASAVGVPRLRKLA